MADAAHFAAGAVTAAVLAGGQGARVDGRDKGLMPLGGRPLVAWVCESLRGQAGRLLICANRHVAEYAAFALVIADLETGYRGPLAGIAAALAACETPWLLTVPVDSPRPPPDLAVRLWTAAVANGADGAAARHGRNREPLFAIYRRELAASAQAALAGEGAVWRWQDRCGAVEADMSDRAAYFANLNTPEDFRRWEAACHD